MSFKLKGRSYNIPVENIYLTIIILCLGFFSLWLPTLYGGVEDARAAGLTVCASGCDHTTILAAAGAASSGDTVFIQSTYNSSTESWELGEGGEYSIAFPGPGVTYICSSTDVEIGGVTSTAAYKIRMDERSSTTFQNCTFNNTELTIASSTVITGNVFNRTTSTLAIVDASNAGFNQSNITVTNNIFNDDWGSNTSSQVMIQFNELAGPHSNIVISSNTFNYEADGVSADPGAIVIPGGSFTIQGNYFKLGSNPVGGDSIAIIAEPSTASGALSLNLLHNTFWVQSQATFFTMLSLGGGNDGVGYQNADVTSTYNIFYSEHVVSDPGVKGVSVEWNTSTFSGTLYEDYNGWYGLDSSDDYIQLSGDATSSFAITFGDNTLTSDPNFKKLDVDTANDMEIAPFSQYLDVNVSEDIGAYSAARGTSFNIDDDGAVDYSTVHATSTDLLDFAKTGDTFTFAAGSYRSVNLTGSPALTGNLTLNGAGATTIIETPANQTGMYLININTSTISNMVVQNASSSATTYAISHAMYTYDGSDYIDTGNIGGPPSAAMVLLDAACGGSDFIYVTADDVDVTSLVSGTDDWHLALSDVGGESVTVIVPNQLVTSSADFASACSGVGLTVDLWVTSTFSNDGSELTYDAATLSGLGVTMYGALEDPAYIESDATEYYGIRLDGSSNNTIENVTSTNNTHGIHFKTTSANNTVSSSVFTANILSDIYVKNSGTNNFKNTSFSTASTTFEGDGLINVYERARAYVTNSSTSAVSGVGVTFTSADESVTETVTTTATGYTSYTDHLLAWTMSSSSVAVTNGGYNPFTVASAASSTYYATSTSSNLSSVNQTFSLVMLNAGITQSTTTLAVTEGSTTSSYTMVLNTQPTNSVVITLATSTADISLSTTTLTFTTANWDTAQTVTVTAVDDSLDEDSESVTISHIASGGDGNYDGISISDVTVTVTDDDTAGVTISDITMSVTEGGSTDNYTAVLASEPTDNVTIALLASGADASISTSSIIFTSANWNTPVTVTVTATDDSTVELSETVTITHTATSDDTNYDAISISDVVATVTDDDVAASSSGGGGTYSNITYPSKMNEDSKDFVINSDVQEASSIEVTLNFNFKNAEKVAISNSKSFDSVEYQDYEDAKDWTLDSGNGTKYVYAKIRSASGGTILVSDNIELNVPVQEQTAPITDVDTDICSLTQKQSYKHSQSTSVYYITEDCTKRAFKRSDVFFTYFDSWDDVMTTTKTKLDSITDDTLGFMPYGPKYDPKYGALVKIVTDPKVYLLLGTEKYWITSETVFTTLNYAWNWIEDVATGLLDKYTVGSEITYTNHHPNYTLIKYEDSSKVYRLEPDPEDANTQVKRWITDEPTFESLNFRWDRIVTIDNTEGYPDGEDL
ncbi:MAG: hypothetical protein HOA57_03575 [Candidatus Magasanikbacteria bacterium]|jgi:parallel beta-helix repeat protein|nr:hypothetical protein [Candidatus Magasanikbacteria bacterium]MBT4314553.1 hypothetical protein [Candidatus Magasanikbacteria bacterium]MBT4547451.1 hypothetical protein [Candidatus Magasanikbacteria bacterium]MBT6819433.1 hypothetical protein [Candidatus Magasanikbacteria bacterium]